METSRRLAPRSAASPGTQDELLLRFGAYELDMRVPELRCAGRPVMLQPKPLHVLAYLATHRDRIVPVAELLEAVWPDVVVTPGVVTSAVKCLRRALGDSGRRQHMVRTRHGYGYQLTVAVSAVDPVDPVDPADAGAHHAQSLVEPESSASGGDARRLAGELPLAELAARLADHLLPILVQVCSAEIARTLHQMVGSAPPAPRPPGSAFGESAAACTEVSV